MSGTNASQSLEANLPMVLQECSKTVFYRILCITTRQKQYPDSSIKATRCIFSVHKLSETEETPPLGCYWLLPVNLYKLIPTCRCIQLFHSDTLSTRPRMPNLCYLQIWCSGRDDAIVSPGSSHLQEERVGGTIASSRV